MSGRDHRNPDTARMSILLSSHAPRNRLVVLGLDGLPLDLARSLGTHLPNIARIAREATRVRAELPELSPVNWTSLATARGPESHSIYGFASMNPQTYDVSVADATQVACPTIFDRLGQAGYVSRIINLPNTYPAQPLRGMLISGFVAQDMDKAAYPPFLAEKLREMHYELEADTNRGASDPAYLLKGLRRTLASRMNALDLLWPDLSWDVFVLVLTETDRLFHFLMDAILHPDHPHHIDCLAFFVEWDAAIGRILERYDALEAPKRLMVVADHGFTELKTEVCLNTWLKHQGLLMLDREPENEWDASCIGPETRAFALDPGRIYMHTSSRFARGQVQPEQTAALTHRIRDDLMALTWNGEQVMEQVHTAAELYPEAEGQAVPDLVCQARPGFDLKAKFDRTEVFGHFGRTGTHTVNGAIWFDSHGSRPERMRDTGAEILKHFDIADNSICP